MHLIYTLLAMLLVGILSLSLLRTSASSEQRMVTNEIMTQVTGVADEVFEHAAGYWFDERVDEGDYPIQPPIFPIITSAQINELTAETDVSAGPTDDGWGGCATSVYSQDTNMGQNRLQNTARPETCDDLDDLHGLTLDMERDGLSYQVEVEVAYVDPLSPTAPTGGTKTFAKAMQLTITTPDFVIGGDPLEVVFVQVFTYDRITTP